MNQGAQEYFKKCSSCKKEIPYSTKYYVCSVSTCRHKRKGFHFCSVPCWDAHLGFANHREAWAVEETSPTQAPVQDSPSSGRSAKRTIVGVNTSSESSVAAAKSSTAAKTASIATDTLVVVSKVKKLIKDQSGFSTSQCCIDALTKKVVEECLKGIEQARSVERKTVMGRDIK